jgi:hypothetical protein
VPTTLMLFIWFYLVRDFIIGVLIAVVSLLTSECMSEYSLLFIVSVIEIALFFDVHGTVHRDIFI